MHVAKKRKKANLKNREFNSDPFSDLKGFAVSAADKDEMKHSKKETFTPDAVGSFAEEMGIMGVEKLNLDSDAEDELLETFSESPSSVQSKEPTDDEIFLTAMGALSVNFRDCLTPDDVPPSAKPRRIKQLRRGEIVPDDSLDLHGCVRSEAVQRLNHFLEDSLYQGWKTVLVITGKGLHSEEGTPILRDEVERYLSDKGKNYVVEWERAPKQYGGAGALILFLRNKSE